MNATLYFHCGDCQASTDIPHQPITEGRNRADITCSQCGERWHITYTVLSLSPLTLSDTWKISRMLGMIKDGVFFEKRAIQ